MLMSVAMMLCVMPCAFATDYTTIDGWKAEGVVNLAQGRGATIRLNNAEGAITNITDGDESTYQEHIMMYDPTNGSLGAIRIDLGVSKQVDGIGVVRKSTHPHKLQGCKIYASNENLGIRPNSIVAGATLIAECAGTDDDEWQEFATEITGANYRYIYMVSDVADGNYWMSEFYVFQKANEASFDWIRANMQNIALNKTVYYREGNVESIFTEATDGDESTKKDWIIMHPQNKWSFVRVDLGASEWVDAVAFKRGVSSGTQQECKIYGSNSVITNMSDVVANATLLATCDAATSYYESVVTPGKYHYIYMIQEGAAMNISLSEFYVYQKEDASRFEWWKENTENIAKGKNLYYRDSSATTALVSTAATDEDLTTSATGMFVAPGNTNAFVKIDLGATEWVDAINVVRSTTHSGGLREAMVYGYSTGGLGSTADVTAKATLLATIPAGEAETFCIVTPGKYQYIYMVQDGENRTNPLTVSEFYVFRKEDTSRLDYWQENATNISVADGVSATLGVQDGATAAANLIDGNTDTTEKVAAYNNNLASFYAIDLGKVQRVNAISLLGAKTDRTSSVNVKVYGSNNKIARPNEMVANNATLLASYDLTTSAADYTAALSTPAAYQYIYVVNEGSVYWLQLGEVCIFQGEKPADSLTYGPESTTAKIYFDEPVTGKVYTAYYDGERLVAVEKADAVDVIEVSIKTKNASKGRYDSAQVLVWDENLNPLQPVRTLVIPQ